jgi:hypothetical protein
MSHTILFRGAWYGCEVFSRQAACLVDKNLLRVAPRKHYSIEDVFRSLSIWWFALILPVLTPYRTPTSQSSKTLFWPQYSSHFSFDLLTASSSSLRMVACKITIPSPFLLLLALHPHPPPIYYVASATMHGPGNNQGVYC